MEGSSKDLLGSRPEIKFLPTRPCLEGSDSLERLEPCIADRLVRLGRVSTKRSVMSNGCSRGGRLGCGRGDPSIESVYRDLEISAILARKELDLPWNVEFIELLVTFSIVARETRRSLGLLGKRLRAIRRASLGEIDDSWLTVLGRITGLPGLSNRLRRTGGGVRLPPDMLRRLEDASLLSPFLSLSVGFNNREEYAGASLTAV